MSELGDGLSVAQKVGMAMGHVEKGAELLRLAAAEGALVLRHADVSAMAAAARAELEMLNVSFPGEHEDGAIADLLHHLEEALER